jgi:hypothetical protein
MSSIAVLPGHNLVCRYCTLLSARSMTYIRRPVGRIRQSSEATESLRLGTEDCGRAHELRVFLPKFRHVRLHLTPSELNRTDLADYASSGLSSCGSKISPCDPIPATSRSGRSNQLSTVLDGHAWPDSRLYNEQQRRIKLHSLASCNFVLYSTPLT